ncbi:helix-turn-helix domain-containing protein [Chitinophaga nivalis]|uniref:Helix-turn-helix transcriptional regulator n=1 Tax=Chitinophaga nivalis TaxID=2991709 RepID=A0ABT3IME2_9BACT|nr:helix-turn-helix transcriptional regulator [Chitinophaga nivalis]MCW3465173.1 helix-turn-helix transcriptional regulator [Chitinophaga nivalis]MCW3485135.1 helix-turn-helix transcriptional regulator [Chitinophaga nivalis]
MTFGQKITLARKDKNWTQAELGDAIGTSRDIVGKYERDEIKPSIEVAAKIADVLDCSLDYLVRGITSQINMATTSPDLIQYMIRLGNLLPVHKDHVIAVIDAFEAKEKIQSKK